MTDRRLPAGASSDRTQGINEILKAKFPWAKIHRLDFPIQLDALSDVLAEIRALPAGKGHGKHRPAVGMRGAGSIVGDSEHIREIRATVEKVAPTTATVLVMGESGTGKEVVARCIHELSGRDGPFVAINCSAIPDNLLESELFGHERGAFTGADSARAGKFELAKTGTVFLDEIGDMPMAMQVKLLRVLQERSVERVGGSRSIAIDVRIVAATHRDLPARITEGLFREDLYYRLSVFPIEILPLRERREDILPLIREMIDRMKTDRGLAVQLPEPSIQLLQEYSWPGNVRELANIVERLAVIKPFGRIEPDDLPRPFRKESSLPVVVSSTLDADRSSPEPLAADLDVKAHLSAVEQQLIHSALQKAEGVVAKAAELLGIGRTTLVEKMKRYGISAAD